MTEDDVVQVLRLMLTAGHNSTTSALGICILAVARDAEVQRRLREDPALIPSAVDEFMRLETPVMAMPRWAAHDTELCGRSIAAGDQLFLVWQSGEPRPRRSGATTSTSASSTGGRTRISSSGTGCTAASATSSRCSSCA